MDAILAEAGEYYVGRYTLGEAGGMLYWPKEYVLGMAESYPPLPKVETVEEARDAYVSYLRDHIAYERTLTGGALLDVESSMTFKYQIQAGLDVLVHEACPGSYEFGLASLRGTGRAYDREYGVHIAISCYGGDATPLWNPRWRVCLHHAYLSGCDFIFPESGHFGRQDYDYHHPAIADCRLALRELYQFANIHTRHGMPRTGIAFVHGHLDGHPGLWNKYVWGQYHGDPKWLFGPAEWGWHLFEQSYRKEFWWQYQVVGVHDYSGHPPAACVISLLSKRRKKCSTAIRP